MRSLLAWACLAGALVASPVFLADALAQPGGMSARDARAKAQVLNKEGVDFLAKKDWANAVDRFQRAYEIFASPKVLLNIAAALREQGRAADAANTYQRYLDDPGSDADRREQVIQILAQSDPLLGLVTVSVSEAGAELQVAGWVPPWMPPGSAVPWLSAGEVAKLRMAPGSFTIRARKDGFEAGQATGVVSQGETRPVVIVLAAAAEPVVAPTPVATVPTDDEDGDDDPTGAIVDGTAPRTGLRLGALIDIAIDGKGEGVAVSPGVSLALGGRVELFGKALIGGSTGGYLGAAYYFSTGRLRPRVSAGLPLFFSDGIRAGARGGAGVTFAISDRLAVVGELGAEYFFNPEMDRVSFVLVPIVGIHAHL